VAKPGGGSGLPEGSKLSGAGFGPKTPKKRGPGPQKPPFGAFRGAGSERRGARRAKFPEKHWDPPPQKATQTLFPDPGLGARGRFAPAYALYRKPFFGPFFFVG